ncbi:hypothetical protein SAMN05216548_10445 [Faunimonas pinastri]|uniref:Uncharacterized protein n=1 Tax=Faunimonas pinastri TaxID=1855383 RepID=A0A1H9F9J9_9HYPH|nr:hypothetical protein [Faunimonas pinastri]SEQ34591.1 hypothetical protein SAMN05216548_10445 [Faunimonas pinastri]
MQDRLDLTDEEWEALLRVSRGAPESRLVPRTILERLIEMGLAVEARGAPSVSPRARRIITRSRER